MSFRLPGACSVALLCAACTPAPAAFTDQDRQAVSQEVRAAVEQLTEAMNAHDGDRVVSFYPGVPDFVYLGCTDYQIGGQSFAARVAPYYRANPDVTFEQRIVSLRVLGANAAVVSLRGRSTVAPNLFWTQVWERGEEGDWGVIVEHESWPGCSEPSAGHPPMGEPTSPEALVPDGGN